VCGSKHLSAEEAAINVVRSIFFISAGTFVLVTTAFERSVSVKMIFFDCKYGYGCTLQYRLAYFTASEGIVRSSKAQKSVVLAFV
jgi:hypothetical protein